MTDSEDSKPVAAQRIHVVDGIGPALGDVIRNLLRKPAEEAGNLIADGIGILGDRVKRKRELNAQIGLSEVSRKLEELNVSIESIIPPKEEQIHLLVEGLSLTDDQSVRDMWVGLFAKALEPGSGVTVERSYINVLQSISSTDAKVISFLAFVSNVDDDFRRKANDIIRSREIIAASADSQDLNAIISEFRRDGISLIKNKAEEYGIENLNNGYYLENLTRLGVIKKVVDSYSEGDAGRPPPGGYRDISAALAHLTSRVDRLARVSSQRVSPPHAIISDWKKLGVDSKMGVKFTGFGRGLVESCGLMKKR